MRASVSRSVVQTARCSMRTAPRLSRYVIPPASRHHRRSAGVRAARALSPRRQPDEQSHGKTNAMLVSAPPAVSADTSAGWRSPEDLAIPSPLRLRLSISSARRRRPAASVSYLGVRDLQISERALGTAAPRSARSSCVARTHARATSARSCSADARSTWRSRSISSVRARTSVSPSRERSFLLLRYPVPGCRANAYVDGRAPTRPLRRRRSRRCD